MCLNFITNDQLRFKLLHEIIMKRKSPKFNDLTNDKSWLYFSECLSQFFFQHVLKIKSFDDTLLSTHNASVRCPPEYPQCTADGSIVPLGDFIFTLNKQCSQKS